MERRQSIMRRRGKTFLSLFLSAVIVTGQPVLAADFSAGEETFISETTEQEGDVSEASAIFEDTVDSDSEMRYEKYEATVSSEILDLGQTGVNGSGWGWERLEIKNCRSYHPRTERWCCMRTCFRCNQLLYGCHRKFSFRCCTF